MEQEQFPAPEKLKPSLEVWILNDEQMVHNIFNSILDSTSYNSNLAVSLKNFFTTEQILEELDKAMIEQDPLPDIVFIDYNFNQLPKNLYTDFKTGVQSIQAIKFYCEQNQIKVPFFLAASIDEKRNIELVNSGANATYGSNLPIQERAERLQKLLRYLLEQKR